MESPNRSELVQQFATAGFIVVEDAVDQGAIDAHLIGIDQFDRDRTDHFDTSLPLREGLFRLRERHAFERENPATLQVQMAPRLVATLATLLGDEPVALFMTEFNVSPYVASKYDGPSFTPHLHNTELMTSPPEGHLLAWIALEDIVDDAGPMWVAPGSHLTWIDLPERLPAHLALHQPELLSLTKKVLASDVSLETWSRLTEAIAAVVRQLIAKAMETEPFHPQPMLLAKGDAVVFHPALLHGTLPPRLPGGSLSRRSCNVRYVARGCDVWNYLHSFSPADREKTRIPRRHIRTFDGWVFDDFVRARYEALV